MTRKNIGRIYKTDKCPTFRKCKDGAFSDSPSNRACSRHGGLAMQRKTKKAVVPAKKETKTIVDAIGEYRIINYTNKRESTSKAIAISLYSPIKGFKNQLKAKGGYFWFDFKNKRFIGYNTPENRKAIAHFKLKQVDPLAIVPKEKIQTVSPGKKEIPKAVKRKEKVRTLEPSKQILLTEALKESKKTKPSKSNLDELIAQFSEPKGGIYSWKELRKNLLILWVELSDYKEADRVFDEWENNMLKRWGYAFTSVTMHDSGRFYTEDPRNVMRSYLYDFSSNEDNRTLSKAKLKTVLQKVIKESIEEGMQLMDLMSNEYLYKPSLTIEQLSKKAAQYPQYVKLWERVFGFTYGQKIPAGPSDHYGRTPVFKDFLGYRRKENKIRDKNRQDLINWLQVRKDNCLILYNFITKYLKEGKSHHAASFSRALKKETGIYFYDYGDYLTVVGKNGASFLWNVSRNLYDLQFRAKYTYDCFSDTIIHAHEKPEILDKLDKRSICDDLQKYQKNWDWSYADYYAKEEKQFSYERPKPKEKRPYYKDFKISELREKIEKLNEGLIDNEYSTSRNAYRERIQLEGAKRGIVEELKKLGDKNIERDKDILAEKKRVNQQKEYRQGYLNKIPLYQDILKAFKSYINRKWSKGRYSDHHPTIKKHLAAFMPNYRVGTRYDRFLYFHKKGSSSDVEIYVRLDFNVEQMVKDLVANLHASKAVRDFKIKNDIDYLHSYNLHEQKKKEKTEQIKNKTVEELLNLSSIRGVNNQFFISDWGRRKVFRNYA